MNMNTRLIPDDMMMIASEAIQIGTWVYKCPGRCPAGKIFQNYYSLWQAYRALNTKYNLLISKGRGVSTMGKKFNYFHWSGVLMTALMYILTATRDGVFTLAEGLNVIQMTARQGIPEIAESDFEGFQAITSGFEFNSFEYTEGDILIVVPAELAKKLKVEFNQ